MFDELLRGPTTGTRNHTPEIQEIESGEIELQDINFCYPTRKVPLFENFNMTIPATKKVALVGHSGCGKSTITNLLLRFYDVQGG